MIMAGDRGWMQIVGGGCFVNVALTGLLIGLASTISIFTVDSIALPFLIGASASFGVSLYLVRDDSGRSVMQKVFLASSGVLLGSVFAVLGFAALLLILPGT